MKLFEIIFWNGKEQIVFAPSRKHVYEKYRGILTVYEVIIS